MIDTVKLRLNILHAQINDGFRVDFDRDGNRNWSVDKTFRVEGSYSKTISVRSFGDPTIEGWFKYIEIEGSFSKFFQGHNITGTDDLVVLTVKMVQYLISENILLPHDFELKPDPEYFDWPRWQRKIEHGEFVVKRLDINYMFKVSGGTVPEYIEFLADTTRTRFSRTTAYGNGTVYWNQKSSHWSMKAYDKLQELNARKKAHHLPGEWPESLKKAIKEFIKPYVRFELELKPRKLRELAEKLGYNDAYWSAFMGWGLNDTERFTPVELYNLFYEKIEVSDMEQLQVDQAISLLSHAAYGTFAAWRSGIDVKANLPRRTYYRHKKEIKEILGVDIVLKAADTAEKHAGTVTRTFRIVKADQDAIHREITQMIAQAA